MTIELGQRCPCGTGLTYQQCCYRFHSGELTASTALALMRSRFTGFVFGKVQYLTDTWDPTTRPHTLKLDPQIKFYRLDIVETSQGGLFDSVGRVKFRAHYTGTTIGIQDEDSLFHKVNGKWFYIAANDF